MGWRINRKGKQEIATKKEEQIEGAEERSYVFIQTMYIRRPRQEAKQE